MRSVRLAIVDDAPFIRGALVRLLKGSPVSVVGTASSGEELLAHLDEWQPEVITLDLSMPGMGGMATLDRIMEVRPTPVIILSTHSGEGAPLTLEALSRGAADFLDKEAYSLVDFQALRRVLLQRIQALAPQVGEEQRGEVPAVLAAPQVGALPPAPAARPGLRRYDLAVIGASTGGPRALEQILGSLGPAGVPVAVVQHMPANFTRAFAERLDRAMPFPVREAVDAEPLLPSVVYVAPGNEHMRIVRVDGVLRVALSPEPQAATHRPSVDVLFESAAAVVAGRTVAVLLTGMGRDGAEGLVRLRRTGAHTIAQDEESCVVYGMPRAAVDRGAAREVIGLDGIAPRLRSLLGEAG